ncbi:MAG: YggS family pyridoxal phosphate-dependent enzyme [Candidatus Eisenbacteria bacterium]|nr:YggS family pyridoxal phosphate-dependent enzyme [Candidatus Eisenbacteria bacterium]
MIKRLDLVRDRIGRAAGRSGRGQDAVTLVAVAKTVPAETIVAALNLGIRDLGENRVQEAEEKIFRVRSAPGGGQARWHLIGHLQRNKAARAVGAFDRVHGVDGLELAAALSRHAVAASRVLPVMIEVNVMGVASQFGVAPDEIEPLVRAVSELPGLALDGLMTVGARPGRAEDSRPAFARLREMRDRVARASGVRLPELSMGMSGDFEVAIEEGSTMVRVGAAIFGGRTSRA